MAKQTILWTVLPYGHVVERNGRKRRRVTVVVSPRLTPEAADEQTLDSFPEFLDWPATLAGARLSLRIGSKVVRLRPLNDGDSALWKDLFAPSTPVAGFRFKNMSQVNMRSYSVRNVLGFLRRHYGRLAVQAAASHPTLLPWRDAHPDLKGMLQAIGTRTVSQDFAKQTIEVALPGFSRFFDDKDQRSLENRQYRDVFGPDGVYRMPVADIDAAEGGSPGQAGMAVRRVLPSDWYDPRPGGPGSPLSPTPDAALMDQFSSADEYTYYQAMRFYRREPPSELQQRMRRPSFTGIPDSPTLPEYDFHRIVASYGDYPHLLRALGLVIDCVITRETPINATIKAGGGIGKGEMSLVVDWSGNHDATADAHPRTAWQATRDRFHTRPRSDELDNGLLRLDGADDRWGVPGKDKQALFDLYQVDPDGATHKTVGFTLTAQNLVARSLSPRQVDGEVTYTTGDKQAPAALRSGGLGVSRHGRAASVAADAAAAALKNQAIEAANGDNVTLFAEDVLRGYRVDVAAVPDTTSPGEWKSLCARSGRYRLIKADRALDLPPDEGHVTGPSTTSTASDSANPDDHYLHESLFRWTGWSLCAPLPGRTLRPSKVENTQLQAEVSSEERDEVTDGNGVAVSFTARKGSLPRLRYGQLYRMRARTVDVAGNSLDREDPYVGELEQASDAVGYWRFDPVDPPAMQQRARLSEGESLERMVIRSNFDVDPAGYLGTADFSAAIALPDSQDFEYTEANERHLVPPKASQQLCEQHGMFDSYFADPASIKNGYAIAAREAGSLFDDTPDAQIELVTPANLGNVATTSTVPPELPGPENLEGDRLRGGQYIIHREALVKTPYLPDAAAAGIALRAVRGHSLPGVSGEMTLGDSCAVRRAPNQELVLLVAHRGDWPDSTGFRIVLEERAASLTELPCEEVFPDDGEPRWDEDQRILTLVVPKGRIVRLVYSSFVHPGLVKTFGVPQWTDSDAEREFVMSMAVMGCHWMLTPFRNLTLVHATQQPVCLPSLEHLSVSRQTGDQHVDLRSRIVRLHGPSTGKFEIEASWHEWVDDLDKEGPERRARRGQLGEIRLDENHVNKFVLSSAVDAQEVDPQRPRARADRHELGDTRFRLIGYRIRATTRFREYLPPSLMDDRDRVTRLGPVAEGAAVRFGAEDDPGAPVLRDPTGDNHQTLVPASAAPDDPRVLYVVPTFQWQSVGSPDDRRIVRHGNGLRVWLDRPWFSSGDGELLGVVLFRDQGRFTDIPDHMQPVVTQWGLDPLWDTALPKTRTRVSDFPARVTSEALRLQERPDDDPVHIVGHRVHWDMERRLWYCDIELDPGSSYMPFVRLALLRYQPNALPGNKVSKVVLAEFSQVLPRRRARFRHQDSTLQVELRGSSPQSGPMKFPVDSEYTDVSFVNGPHEIGRNRVELVLQTRAPGIDSDLAWRDEQTLAGTIVGDDDDSTGGVVVRPYINPRGIFALPATKAADSRTLNLRAGSAVKLANEIERGAATDIEAAANFPLQFFEPEIWSINVDLPDINGKLSRVMLREFERYYTDRTVPERRSRTVHRRRVIEERLVYAVVFEPES